MKNPNSGIWKVAKDDNFTKEQLLDIQIFFENLLITAKINYVKFGKLKSKYPHLTTSGNGFKDMSKLYQRKIFEADKNLEIVRELILLHG